jgi:hypothetical protein
MLELQASKDRHSPISVVRCSLRISNVRMVIDMRRRHWWLSPVARIVFTRHSAQCTHAGNIGSGFAEVMFENAVKS